ncbi:MAG: MFS transporter [Candidatus Omnitrophica bacterium]|nr:MFS transporter [Candidatus Omnitrophota bacterium]
MAKRSLESLTVVTVAGCLAMVYTTFTTSPLATEFFRHIGATEIHFGLLSGLPMIMLVMQFAGAFLTNRISRRKPWFMFFAIVARTLYLPVAFLPLLFPSLASETKIRVMLILLVLSSGLANLIVPVWFSWMGDLIPRRILNRYWGGRQRWMTLVWTLSYLTAGWMAFSLRQFSPVVLYALACVLGVTAGVIDISLFRWVPEPENERLFQANVFREILEPFSEPHYRSFLVYICCFHFSVMIGSCFMQLYVLKILKIPVWQTILIWSTTGLGGALVAKSWGWITDRHGHRPVLSFCTSLKPGVALVFALITRQWAPLILPIVFFFDNMLNSGNTIAINGYMLKMAPRKNRSAFVAAVTALTGIFGGIGAMVAGIILRHTTDFQLVFAGRSWNNYQLLFFLSFVCRVFCVSLALAIKEPTSASPVTVINYLMGQWPMRMLMFPVGLYRKFFGDEERFTGS